MTRRQLWAFFTLGDSNNTKEKLGLVERIQAKSSMWTSVRFATIILCLLCFGCASKEFVVGDYSRREFFKESLLRVEADSVVMISYMSVGDGYSVFLGTYRLRGRRVICKLTPFHLFLDDSSPPEWKMSSTVVYKYRITEEGNLQFIPFLSDVFHRRDDLDPSQLELLELAPSLVIKDP